MATKKSILKEYIDFRSLKNKGRGLKDIEFHINKFITSSKKSLKNFEEKNLLDYIVKITPNYKTSMLNTIKSSYIKNFTKWYFADWSSRFRNLDKICKTEMVGETYKPEDMISEKEFEKLVKGEETNFWKAYFMTLFYGGCRPVEVCNLKWKEVKFEEDGAYITIYSKKNKRSFIKFVPENVSFYLKKLQDNGSEYVFYNPKKKKPIGVKGAYWKLGILSKEVLGKKINLYLLRHSIATIIYNKDYIKDDDIARQMGHSKSMKGKYVHNNIDRLKETARKIYINPEELPPEKKHELEMKVEKLTKMVLALAEKEELDISKAFVKHASGIKTKEEAFEELEAVAQ
jgi:integrase